MACHASWQRSRGLGSAVIPLVVPVIASRTVLLLSVCASRILSIRRELDVEEVELRLHGCVINRVVCTEDDFEEFVKRLHDGFD